MGYAKSMSSHSAKAVNTPAKVGGNRAHRHPAGRQTASDVGPETQPERSLGWVAGLRRAR